MKLQGIFLPYKIFKLHGKEDWMLHYIASHKFESVSACLTFREVAIQGFIRDAFSDDSSHGCSHVTELLH